MQRLLLEAALLVRLHSWPPSISVWFPSAITVLAACSCTLIHTWFIHSLHSLLISLLSSLFRYLCMHLSLSCFSVLLSSCRLSTHHLPFLWFCIPVGCCSRRAGWALVPNQQRFSTEPRTSIVVTDAKFRVSVLTRLPTASLLNY